MSRWVLDTSVVVHTLRASPVGAHLRDLADREEAVEMMSVVSMGELLSLAEQNNWGSARRAMLEQLLNEVVLVDLRAEARGLLETYARIDRLTQSRGRQMTKNDLWIAATAAFTDSLLVTLDKDFEAIPQGVLRLWLLDERAGTWPLTPPA